MQIDRRIAFLKNWLEQPLKAEEDCRTLFRRDPRELSQEDQIWRAINLGWHAFIRGKNQEARKFFEKGTCDTVRKNHTGLHLICRFGRGCVVLAQGDTAKALKVFFDILAGDNLSPIHKAVVWLYIAKAKVITGDPREALDCCWKARRLLSRTEVFLPHFYLEYFKAYARFQLKDPQTALRNIQKARDIARQLNSSSLRGLALGEAGSICLQMGRIDQARALNRKGLALLKANRMIHGRPRIFLNLTDAALTQRRTEEAGLWLDRCLDLEANIDDPVYTADLALRLSRYHELSGDSEKALKHHKTYHMLNRSLMKIHRQQDLRALMVQHKREAESQINSVAEIVRKVTSTLDFETVLQESYDQINQLMDATVFGIALLTPNRSEMVFELHIEEGKKTEKIRFSAEDESRLTNQCWKSGRPIINNQSYDSDDNPGVYVPALVEREKSRPQSYIFIPLIADSTPLGVMTVQSYYPGAYNIKNQTILKTLGAYVAIAIQNATKSETLLEVNRELESKKKELTVKVFNRERKIESLTLTLVKALESANQMNDTDTGNHIDRVRLYSELLARIAGCSEGFVRKIRLYASLHDIGKVAIPDALLKKKGPLTGKEFELMKTHVERGYELIDTPDIDPMARNIVLYHHEKWDGTGYQAGLSGQEIPLEARIVALADVFDALSSSRSYKDAFAPSKSLSIIKNERGLHFDPRLVDLFSDHFEEFQAIAENPPILD